MLKLPWNGITGLSENLGQDIRIKEPYWKHSLLDFWPMPFCPRYCGNTALPAEVSLSFACSILILCTQERPCMNRVRFFSAWEACCWDIISNPDLIAVCLLQCTVGSVTTIGLSITVNPLLSPSLSNNKPLPFQRRKVNKPPLSIKPSPSPPYLFFTNN